MSNLLPDTQKNALLRLYRMRVFTLLFLGIAGVLAGSIILIVPSVRLSESINHSLTEKRALLAGRETTNIQASLLKTVATINARLNMFTNNGPESIVVGRFIDPVLSVKTTGVHISQFKYSIPLDKKQVANIQISGTTSARQSLLEYADALRALPHVSEVVVPLTSFIKDQNSPFVITAALDLK